MYNTTPMPLSNEGSFEEIVNARTTQQRQKKQIWFSKTMVAIVVLLIALLVNILLWLFRVIPSMPSIFVSVILTSTVSFFAGRIYEKFCK